MDFRSLQRTSSTFDLDWGGSISPSLYPVYPVDEAAGFQFSDFSGCWNCDYPGSDFHVSCEGGSGNLTGFPIEYFQRFDPGTAEVQPIQVNRTQKKFGDNDYFPPFEANRNPFQTPGDLDANLQTTFGFPSDSRMVLSGWDSTNGWQDGHEIQFQDRMTVSQNADGIGWDDRWFPCFEGTGCRTYQPPGEMETNSTSIPLSIVYPWMTKVGRYIYM